MRLLFLALALLELGGCAVYDHAYGPGVQSLAEPHPDGLATVYIVRRSPYGFAVPIPLAINGVPVWPLLSRRYLRVVVYPGPVQIESGVERICTVTFDAEAENAYYFELRARTGWRLARSQLDAVDPDWGVRSIAWCSETTGVD